MNTRRQEDMAKYSNTVEYNIRTTLDNSGIARLQSELTQLQNKINILGAKNLIPETAVTKTLGDIKKVQTALNNAFNPKLGMLNTSKFMSEIKAAGLSMNSIYKSFSQAGAAGQRAFTSMYGQIGKIDTGLRSVSKTTDKIFNTMGNTFRWGIIASGFAGMMNSIHEAAEYTKDLDKSLTNIMMVSGETRDNMNEYARTANEVAQKLGSTTVAMTDATQVFIQQGYDLQKSQELATYSTVLANVSQQDTATASDEITAYMNAYKIPLDDIGNALSKWAEVANVSAADVEELSVASQKAASVATTVGVDMDQLAATIATIETVTREAPENIGNGLKTIYSRLSDVKLGETLEDGVNLGQITSQLQKVGVQVLDEAGQMRDVGAIVEDLMDVWQTLSQTEKAATATTLAGRFQLARFEALMNRSDLYKQYLSSSREQTGTETLDFMQETYQESLEGRLNALQSKIEEVFLNLFESNSFNGAVDALSGLVDALNEVIKATGGGETALLGLSTVLINLASNSVSRGISNFITNRQQDRLAQQNVNDARSAAYAQLQGRGINTSNERLQNFATDVANVNKYAPLMNDEQIRSSNELLEQRVAILNQLSSAEEKQVETEGILRMAIAAYVGEEREAHSVTLLSTEGLIKKTEAILRDAAAGEKLSITISEIGGKTRQTAEEYTKFSEGLLNGSVRGAAAAAAIKKMIASLEALGEMGVLSVEQSEILAEQIEKLSNVSNYSSTELKKLGKSGLELGKILSMLAEATNLDTESLERYYQTLYTTTEAIAGNTSALQSNERQYKGMAEGMQLQDTTNKLIGLATGIGQLAFAWQSFKNLGNLLTDENLSFEEKFIESIINISFAIPMLVTGIGQAAEGFRTLTQVLKEFSLTETLINGLQKATNAAIASNIVLTEGEKAVCAELGITKIQLAMAEKMVAEGKAETIFEALGLIAVEEAETGATLGLAAAFKTLTVAMLTNPITWIVAALAGLGIAIGVIAHNMEEAKKKFEENLNASNEVVNAINTNKNSYDELYNKYKETGEGADELKEKATALGESLGVQGAKALADAGNFDTLNKKIQEATESQLAYNAALLAQKREDQEDKLKTDLYQDKLEKNGYADMSMMPDNQGAIDVTETLTERQRQYNQYQEQIKEATVELIRVRAEGGDTKAIEARIQSYKDEANAIKLTAEDLEYLNNIQQENDSRFKAGLEGGAYDNLDFGTNVQDYRDFLLQDDLIKKYYDYLKDTAGQEAADAYIDGMIGQIAERLPTELKEQLQMALKATDNEPLINTVVKDQGYTEEEALEKLGVDKTQFQAMKDEYESIAELNSEGPYNSQGLKEWRDSINSSIKDLRNQKKALEDNITALEKDGKEVDDNGKSLTSWKNDLNATKKLLNSQERQLKNYDDALTNLAAKYMESAEGLESLSENFDKWEEALNNGSSKEQAEAYGEISEALGQLMNTDASNFDSTFIKNNLDLIRDAANGSGEALSQLRENAAQEILVKAKLADDIDNIPTYLQDVLDTAQAICDNDTIEAGASLDPSAFIAGLQAMEAQGLATTQNLMAYFDALEASGVEAYIEEGSIANLIETVGVSASSMLSNLGLDTSNMVNQLHNASMTMAVKLNQVRFRKIGNTGSSFAGSHTGGSGGGKGGGGGGGGGGKSYEPKHKDPIEEEIDRYEKVQTALDEVDSQINKLTIDQDRLMGNNWIENLEKETGLLQEQIPLYEEKLRIQKEEQQELQKQLADNYGARFNDIGLLQNYAEIHKRLEKEVNDLINRYNSTTTEEGQNALEKQIESAQERLEKFKKQYQRYDTLVSKDMIDTQKALEEIQNRLEDIRYEAYKARKEAAEQLKDLRDDRREFNESIATLFNDDTSLSLGNAMSRFKDLFQADEKYVADAITMYKKKLSQATSEDMKKFYQAQIDSLKKAQANGTSVLDLNFQRLNEVMAEYDKWLAGGQTSWSEADLWEAMQDAFDDAVDLAKELKDQVDDIHDKIADVIDEMDEATERRKDAFESINDELEYMRDMSELLYGDQAYATQAQTYNLQAHNNEQLLKTLEAAQKANQKILEATKDNAAAQEEYQAALEKEKELQGEILDTRKEIAEAYKDAKEAANNLAVQNWLDQFQGEIDGVKVPLKYAQEAWERINENADLYLDELNRAWETEKLQNKYLELINNNTDPAIQKQITDQMNQQLGYLRDKTNLSKYDVEYANAQLEILQKTIALEDARANKNQMRLRRDTQGNYSYVYAASQADIASAENDLLDAQMNGYNISVEANRNSADSFYQKIQAMADQLRDAANDATLSEEQIAAITADIIKDGYEYLDAMGEQLTTAQKNMIESFIQAAQNLGAENSQAVQIIADELINNVDATVETISDKFVSGVERMIGPDGLALFREEAEQTRDDIVQNVHDFETAIGDVNVNIQTPLTDIDTNLQHTTTSMSELADEAQRFYDIMNNNTGVILQAAGELAEYQAKLTDAENELSVYSEKVNKLGQDLETQKTINTQLNATNSDLQRQLEQAKKDAENARNGGGSGSGSGSGGSLTRNRVGEVFYLIHYGQVGNEGDRTPNLRNRGYSDREIRAGQKAINLAYLNDYDNEDAISWAAAHMKTGGYTGTWSGANTDNNGKLAVLHQKELVLNAADTENILSAVDIIRNIVAALKGNISGGLLTNMISSIGQTGGDTIEQRVEIKAEFPNATSAREIEEAFDTIANTSYQYAYNKNTKVI